MAARACTAHRFELFVSEFLPFSRRKLSDENATYLLTGGVYVRMVHVDKLCIILKLRKHSMLLL